MVKKTLVRWCETEGESIRALDVAVRGGGQVAKFASGERLLPLPLAARVSDHTGIPLSRLLEPEQMTQARSIFAAVARSL